MNVNKFVMYALAVMAGGGIAVLAGLPPYFLLLFACPLMMLLMMSSMSAGLGHDKDGASIHDEETASEKRGSTP